MWLAQLRANVLAKQQQQQQKKKPLFPSSSPSFLPPPPLHLPSLMNYLELLNGCYLAAPLHGAAAAAAAAPTMFSSKTERIMARFRPIAPKPLPYNPNAPLPSDPPPLSSLSSADSLLPAKTKRARKRRCDSDTRASKRPAAGSGKSDKPGRRFAAGNNSDIARIPQNTGPVGQIDPFAVVFPQGSISKGNINIEPTGKAHCESSAACDETQSLSNLAPGTPNVNSDMKQKLNFGPIGNARMFQKDFAFIEKAAASAPTAVIPDRKIGGRTAPKCDSFGGNFTEMIRSITGLTSAAELHSLMRPKWTTNVKGTAIEVHTEEASLRRAFPPMSPMDHAADGAKLVTLRLLPDTPSRIDSPEESSLSTCTSVSNRKSRVGGLSDDIKVVSTSNCYSPPFLDQRDIEKAYGTSSDPVLLMDDSQKVLWFNKAYERAAHSVRVRMAGKGADIGPFIDPLGFPTHLGSFRLQSSIQTGSLSATLWGFLRKIVVLDVESATQDSTAVCLTSTPVVPDAQEGKKNGVITPQPKRLIGSTVSLESVTEVHLQATALSERMEEIENDLEEGTIPAFMTDASNRVRWVNTAYKKMIGQPKCPWLASTVISNGGSWKVEGGMATGEVLLVGTDEKIPDLAAAFSGRVNIQWRNRGERSSMTVPCDVTRLCGRSGGDMFVWKFDVEASLRLTCGS